MILPVVGGKYKVAIGYGPKIWAFSPYCLSSTDNCIDHL